MTEHHHNSEPATIRRTIIAVSLVIGVLASLLAGFYLMRSYDLPTLLKTYLESHIHPGVFLALMLLLPMAGVPLSIFLILVGMKFGIWSGIALTALLMAMHMMVAYYLSHSFLHPWLTRLFDYFGKSLPRFDKGFNRWHIFLFMLVPGLPYALKNYLLALVGIPFVTYMVINWSAQFALSIPFIVLGHAILEMDLSILTIALTLLLASFFLQHYLRNRYGKKDKPKSFQ